MTSYGGEDIHHLMVCEIITTLHPLEEQTQHGRSVVSAEPFLQLAEHLDQRAMEPCIVAIFEDADVPRLTSARPIHPSVERLMDAYPRFIAKPSLDP